MIPLKSARALSNGRLESSPSVLFVILEFGNGLYCRKVSDLK